MLAVTVDLAMTAWGDYVAQNHPDAAQAYANLATSDATNAVQLAAALVNNQNASAAESQALADLVAMLQRLGVKL